MRVTKVEFLEKVKTLAKRDSQVSDLLRQVEGNYDKLSEEQQSFINKKIGVKRVHVIVSYELENFCNCKSPSKGMKTNKDGKWESSNLYCHNCNKTIRP